MVHELMGYSPVVLEDIKVGCTCGYGKLLCNGLEMIAR
jgi:hypothetical protein